MLSLEIFWDWWQTTVKFWDVVSISDVLGSGKAFEYVDHAILIQKLCHYGVRGKELDCFKSYLQDRKQCCKVN